MIALKPDPADLPAAASDSMMRLWWNGLTEERRDLYLREALQWPPEQLSKFWQDVRRRAIRDFF